MKIFFNKNHRSYLFVVVTLCAAAFGFFSLSCSRKNELVALQGEVQDRARLLVTNSGKPTDALLELLAILDLKHDGSLKNIVEVTQKNLLRPAGKERWQISESMYAEKQAEIFPQLEKLGLFKKNQASQKNYRYSILLGATVSSVRNRLAFLMSEWERGVRFNEIIILAGQRILDSEKESEITLYDRANKILPIKQSWQQPEKKPATETEMIKMLFEQVQFSDDLGKIPRTFIDAHSQKNSDGSVRRPTTSDTVKAWLAQNPVPGSCLVISCQPYVTYQDSVMKTLMPASFLTDTIGAEVDTSESLATLLDTVARILYQELLRFNSFEKAK